MSKIEVSYGNVRFAGEGDDTAWLAERAMEVLDFAMYGKLPPRIENRRTLALFTSILNA